MTLAQHVNTFGQALLRRYGERVHKVAIDAGFTSVFIGPILAPAPSGPCQQWDAGAS